jgi:beta-glucosidase
MNKRFPPDFIWGTATSAWQIEGATQADGRSDSIWDVFTRQPDSIKGGVTADMASKHYWRQDEDLELLKALAILAG